MFNMWMRAFLRGHAGGGEIYRNRNLFFRIFFVSREDSFGVCVFYQIRMILPEDLKPFWGNEKLNLNYLAILCCPFFGVVNSVTLSRFMLTSTFFCTSRCHFESPGICMFEDVESSNSIVQTRWVIPWEAPARCLRWFSLFFEPNMVRH